jgi:hypothetical protein
MNEPKFKVGQKVKVVEGGWGVHPNDVGQSVVIDDCRFGAYLEDSFGYKVVGQLPYTDDTDAPLVGKGPAWFDEKSFESVEELPKEVAEDGISFNIIRDEDGYIDMTIFGNLSTYQIKTIMDVALGPKEVCKPDISKYLRDNSQS